MHGVFSRSRLDVLFGGVGSEARGYVTRVPQSTEVGFLVLAPRGWGRGPG